MGLTKKVNLIIYRFRERGLEVFFLQDDNVNPPAFLTGEMDVPTADAPYIELDPVQENDGQQAEAYAVEGDWHEIPSLKAMLYQDAVQLKEKIKTLEQGTFVGIKEALKTALPHQYAFLKELKDILADRNSLKDL